MIKIYKYLITTFLLFPLFSFSQKVENIHFEQEGKQIYIYYNLIGTDIYDISIYCSEDNGNTWGNPLHAVSGDVGNGIIPGNNKKVVWDVLTEKTKLTGNIKFKIQVESFVLLDPRDGQKYKTVKIGNQIWMAENLNYKTDSSWCYDNNPDNCEVYGRLYTWNAAMKACPKGWHLPSDEEWKTLEMALGMSRSDVNISDWRGTNEGSKMKSTNGWVYNDNSSNKIGFNALPGGFRNVNGLFNNIDYSTLWWTSTENSSIYIWTRGLSFDTRQVLRGYDDKKGGYSIRCLKN